jgi:chemotaxis protein MotB
VGGTSDPLKSIADDISAAFGDLISSNQMTVRGNELWVEIELNSSLLFGSGDAMPSDRRSTSSTRWRRFSNRSTTRSMSKAFTDNLPIRTAQYPTNWELSSARSASIVRMLAMQG